VSRYNYYRNRVPELDLLRGLAIAMVLLRHYPILGGFRQLWIGVDIFFTLSGFLVAGILIREYNKKGRVRVGRFLVRRGLKIYPSFYLFLFLTAGAAFVAKVAGKPVFFPELNPGRFLVEAFYLQSLMGGLWWHTWSLAVEEHFYILLALIVFVLSQGRQMITRLFAISLLFIPLCLAIRLVVAGNHPEFSYTLHYNNTFLRLDSLFFGVMLACLYHYLLDDLKNIPVYAWILMVAAGISTLAGWLLFYPLESMETARFGFAVIYVGFGLVLFGFMGLRLRSEWSGSARFRNNPVFRSLLFMGRNSYNIYLWHALALEGLMLASYTVLGISLFDPMTWYFFTAYISLSVMMGVAATYFVEIPLLKWRDRKFAGTEGSGWK
jgi:peptidoglycan/LPS O-acetylase OafA/YrhL